LEAAIRKQFPEAQVELIRGSGGTFVVHRDGVKIWDKNADQSGFPDESKLVAGLAKA